MGFFQTLSNVFSVVLSFFPRWFSSGLLALFVAWGVSAVVSLAQRLKDIFWPF